MPEKAESKPFNIDDFRPPPPSRLKKFRWWLRQRMQRRFDQRAVDRLFQAVKAPYTEEYHPEDHEAIWSAFHYVDPKLSEVWVVFLTDLIMRLRAVEARVKVLEEGKNPHGFLQ